MKNTITAIVVLLLTSYAVNAQEIETPAFGKGMLNLRAKDSSWTMKVATRIQLLSQVNWRDEDGEFLGAGSTDFNVRRARLKFDGHAFSPKLTYKIELGLSNQDIGGASTYTNNAPRYILDAVAKWNFYKNFTLWFGQTKLPGNIERVISSGNLQMVDRSLVNARFNIDRDMGLQLHHKFTLGEKFVVRDIAALSQGEGRNITVGNLGGYQYTGRIELLPFGEFAKKGDYSGADLVREKSPKLLLAATYDHNQNAVRNRSNMGSFMTNDIGFYETNINTLFADLMFKYRGFSVMMEYADRDAEDPIAKNSDGTPTGAVVQVGNGINVQSGYVFPSNWEISGRLSSVYLDREITGIGNQNEYTLGLSKYIVGHNLKVQSDLTYFESENPSDRLMFRLQLDIHF